jgi:hypothetical protein
MRTAFLYVPVLAFLKGYARFENGHFAKTTFFMVQFFAAGHVDHILYKFFQ